VISDWSRLLAAGTTLRAVPVQAAIVNVIEPIFERARFRLKTVLNTVTDSVRDVVAKTGYPLAGGEESISC